MTLNRINVLIAMTVILALGVFVVACGGESAAPAASPPATAETVMATTAPAAPTTAPMTTATTAPPAPTETRAMASTQAAQATTAPTEAPQEPPTPAEAMPSGAATVFTLSEGTIARYKVEEELANTGFFVATGETMDVAGSIWFDADGAVIREESLITVQAATLMTDSGRRDGYVRNRTLETDTYPEVVFVPTSIDGLPEFIADASGHAHVHITGDLTVKDQTREVTWDGEIDFAGDGTASGSVAVEFTFEDFGMNKPRVAVVLSVDDTIRLEMDFVGTTTAP